MTRVISFSLYGDAPQYTINAIINCLLAPAVYPGWTCHVYLDETVPGGVKAVLGSLRHVEVLEMPRHRDGRAMLWRFLPAADAGVEAMISRDADSWVSSREAACVNEWLAGDRDFHIVRDHCYHSHAMMGGMWGARGGQLPELGQWIEQFPPEGGSDQDFLAQRVYPLAVQRALIHRGEQRNNGGEVASYFDDGAVPIPAHEEIDEAVPGLSFLETQRLNAMHCSHCGATHRTFVGAMLNQIPLRALDVVRQVASDAGIAPETIPGLAITPAGVVERRLRRYRSLLDEHTQDGEPPSASRADSLQFAFTHFLEQGGRTVVELGTIRSFVHGGLLGCNEDDPAYWCPDEPERWDWGAGCFSLLAAECLHHVGPTIHTVDVVARHIERCKVVTAPYAERFRYHVADSVKFLRSLPRGSVDLLYLDTGDMWPIEPTARHQLEEARTICRRRILSERALVLIDDVRNDTPRRFGDPSPYAKAKYSIPYLLERGFEVVFDGYQVALAPGPAPRRRFALR